jgi:hypothetical protein
VVFGYACWVSAGVWEGDGGSGEVVVLVVGGERGSDI